MTLMICNCQKCKHEWPTHKERWKDYDGFPVQCPKCKSAKWRKIKKKGG